MQILLRRSNVVISELRPYIEHVIVDILPTSLFVSSFVVKTSVCAFQVYNVTMLTLGDVTKRQADIENLI